MLAYLLPASLLRSIEEAVKVRLDRWCGLADRSLDLMAQEVEVRRQAFLETHETPAIEAELPVNRIVEATNGKKKARS